MTTNRTITNKYTTKFITKKRVKKSGRAYAALPLMLLIVLALLFSLVPAEALALTDIGTVYTKEALLGDLDSGAVLFSQNADERVIPASTTKVLTAMLIIEAIERGELDADEKVMATQAIIDGVIYDASRVLPYIQDGEELTVREYLYCIMLGSDCVACDILADRVSGSVENFVRLMNDRAAELGCTDTNFMNTHGYPVEGHYTTPRSLFLIMRQAMQYELFRDIISTIKIELPKTEQSKEVRKLYNSNWMIWNPDKITSMYTVNYYPYSIGGKTGSSNKSGHCLVSCAQKDGVTLVAVVTGAVNEIAQESGQWTNRSFSESRKLFEWGFANFEKYTLMTSGTDAGTVAVSGGESGEVGVAASGEVAALLPRGVSVDQAELRNVYDSQLIEAPVSSGDVLGRVEVYYDGTLRGGTELVATGDIARRAADKPAPVKEKDGSGGKSGKTLVVMILVTFVIFAGALLLYITNNKKIILPEYYAGSKGAAQITRKTAEFFTGSVGADGGDNAQGEKKPRAQGTGKSTGTAIKRHGYGMADYSYAKREPGSARAAAPGRANAGTPSRAKAGTPNRAQTGAQGRTQASPSGRAQTASYNRAQAPRGTYDNRMQRSRVSTREASAADRASASAPADRRTTAAAGSAGRAGDRQASRRDGQQ